MEALETAIVNRITADPNLPSGVAVLSWPDNPLRPSVPAGNTALILVQFVGQRKNPSPQPSSDRILQSGRIEASIRFFTKTLRTNNSAYLLLRTVERVLSAWVPSNIEQGYCADRPGLQLTEEQMVGNDKTVWDWEQLYVLPFTYTHRSI